VGTGSLILALFLQAAPDTATFADRATRDLVARAVQRHAAADSSVRDYQAALRYRLSFGVGKRRWAAVPPAAVEEQEGRVQWSLPNDLRVDLLGRRGASRLDGVDLSSNFSRPWFVPRTLGDSIRLLGDDTDGARAAPHPLGPGGTALYRYRAGDSLVIVMGAARRRLTIRSIEVTPRPGLSSAVVGKLWVDVATGDVVRFTFRFVGTNLWDEPEGTTARDSAEARRANRIVSRILQIDADLEYALQDDRHWLPFRQRLTGRVTVPIGPDLTVPFEATTTFNDYTINTGQAVAFSVPIPPAGLTADQRRVLRDSLRAERRSGVVPDSLRARDRVGRLPSGGRYQIHRPPVDSMRTYAGWADSLVLDADPVERTRLQDVLGEVAAMAEQLPGEMTGRPGAGLAWERLPDFIRYNRVQGTTLSFVGRTGVPLAFSELVGTARYGLADQRLMATVAYVRDAPSGRFTLRGGRDLVDLDPFTRGLTFGNSLRGILAGRDDGAYALGQGVRLSHERALGLATELTIGALVEDHQSGRTEARAGIPRVFGADGFFTPNAPVREGLATGASVQLDRLGYRGAWTLRGEALAVDGELAGRATLHLRRDLARGWLITRTSLGVATRADVVPQMALRAGGLRTVRGYDFGVASGDALWALQLDIAAPGNDPLKWVGFLDAGQAGKLSAFGAAPLLSGVGVGASILGGLIRAELSHPLTERAGRSLRFDLVFGGVR
jgi:hypothetical protein